MAVRPLPRSWSCGCPYAGSAQVCANHNSKIVEGRHSQLSADVQASRSGWEKDGPMTTQTQSKQSEAKLLVVEDDANILELLSASLRFAGFEVSTATSGSAAVTAAKSASPDLVVLDVMLPDLDGFEVIRLMREGGARTPVVFLTARDGTDDKIRGLTLGGDDYVTKPFSLEELTARIRAVLRRTTAGDETPSRLTFADLELDEETHEVYRAGQRVQLSPTEFKLLRYLMLNANRVLSKAQILDHVWKYDFRGDDNIVESYISYLRRKVDNVQPRLIHTLRGVGYVLRKPAT
jgi:two-component system, OmpR family, response regulator